MKREQKLFFRIAFALCALSLLFTLVTSTTFAQMTVKVVTAANLRSGPGTEYRIVGGARAGDVLAVHSASGSWYNVGRGRWIASWLTNGCTDPDQVCDFKKKPR